MLNPGCLWNRPRLERYVDDALSARLTRGVENHIARCAACRGLVESQRRFESLISGAVVGPAEPDWTGFWPGIQARLARGERPVLMREPWWQPFWRPFWGHPRLALGGATAAVLATALSFWPGGEGQIPLAYAGPVVVQDVGTPDPERAVMVYSTADQALTVIWLFPAESSPTDES